MLPARGSGTAPDMFPNGSRDHVIILAYAVLILFAPVTLLVLTLGFLILTGDLVLGRLTPLEFLELYLLELIVFVGFGYGLYRLTLWVAAHRLPALLDQHEVRDTAEIQSDNSGNSDEDRR